MGECEETSLSLLHRLWGQSAPPPLLYTLRPGLFQILCSVCQDSVGMASLPKAVCGRTFAHVHTNLFLSFNLVKAFKCFLSCNLLLHDFYWVFPNQIYYKCHTHGQIVFPHYAFYRQTAGNGTSTALYIRPILRTA